MSIGQVIRDNRIRLNMSQEKLAEKLGVTQKVISKYERESSIPPAKKLIALADVFDVTVDSLLREDTCRCMTLGQVIRENRNGMNMTQTELADRLGLSQETIANYEAGTRKPPIDTVAAMAHVFGISVDYLLGREDAPLALLESRNILDERIGFEGTLSISDRKYRISLSIAPSGEELNG